MRDFEPGEGYHAQSEPVAQRSPVVDRSRAPRVFPQQQQPTRPNPKMSRTVPRVEACRFPAILLFVQRRVAGNFGADEKPTGRPATFEKMFRCYCKVLY